MHYDVHHAGKEVEQPSLIPAVHRFLVGLRVTRLLAWTDFISAETDSHVLFSRGRKGGGENNRNEEIRGKRKVVTYQCLACIHNRLFVLFKNG